MEGDGGDASNESGKGEGGEEKLQDVGSNAFSGFIHKLKGKSNRLDVYCLLLRSKTFIQLTLVEIKIFPIRATLDSLLVHSRSDLLECTKEHLEHSN